MRSPGVIIGAVLFLAAVAAGVTLVRYRQPQAPVTAAAPASTDQQSMVGRPRPGFTLADVNGKEHQVNEWDGRVLALNFWATWCPPCRKEIPQFVALQKKYGDRGLQFVGIALQDRADVRDFIREFHMNYPVLAGEMPVVRIAKSYGDRFGALPYTVIIGRDGHIAFTNAGALSADEAERQILKLL